MTLFSGWKYNASELNRFYLWSTVMVLVCCFIGILVYGGGRYAFGVFMKPMADNMAWSRTEVSLAITINLLVYSISSPIIGWLYDKLGIRKVMLGGAILFSLSLCAMYLVDSLWSFYLLYGVVGAFGANAVGRMGQATIVVHWFVKNRGLMMGVTSLSIGVGTAIMAPLVRVLLDNFGWRLAFTAMGVMVALLIVVPVFLFVKGQGKPEDRGLTADGEPASEGDFREGQSKKQALKEGWPVNEVLRSMAFWGIALSVGLTVLAGYLILIHSPAHFEEIGFSGTTAASVLSIATLSSCIGRVGIGWLIDRAPVQLGFGVLLGLQLAAMPLILWGGSSIIALYLFAIVWGAGYGGTGTYMPVVMVDYFGNRNFGTIYGWLTMITVLCSSAGGVLGGWIYDTQHSYRTAWQICIILFALSLVIMYTLGKKPVRKPLLQRS